MNLIPSDRKHDAFTRRGNAVILKGADAQRLPEEPVRADYSYLNFDFNGGWRNDSFKATLGYGYT